VVQKNILPEEWHRNTIDTLRDKLIHHGASIEFIGDVCNLRLNASFRYKTELNEILEKLRHEVHIHRIASHKDLRDFQS
jgi:hypothetical protein